MKDRTTGAGALAAGILVALLTFAGLSSLPVWMIGITILAAEVLGKMAMGLSSALGKPFADGIQKYIYDHSKRRFAVYTVLISLPVLLLGFVYPVAWWICAAFAGAVLTFVILFFLAKKLFGGINGDVTGASNELTRMAVCVILGIQFLTTIMTEIEFRKVWHAEDILIRCSYIKCWSIQQLI